MVPRTHDHDPETYAIIGAAMTVHRELGSGFLEHVYHEALEEEFKELGIPFRREVDLEILYKGKPLACPYRADFICSDCVVLEIKALQALATVHRAQLINYLKAASVRRGLLINFGAKSLEFERVVYG